MQSWQLADWLVALPLTFFVLFGLVVVVQDRHRLGQLCQDGQRLLPRLSRELERGNRAEVLEIGGALGGVVGALVEEGVQLAEHSRSLEDFRGAFAVSRRLSLSRFEGGLYLVRVAALGSLGVSLLGQGFGVGRFLWGGIGAAALVWLGEQILRFQLLRFQQTLERLQLLLSDYWQRLHIQS